MVERYSKKNENKYETKSTTGIIKRRRFLHLTGATLGTGPVIGTTARADGNDTPENETDFVYPATGTIYRTSLDYPIDIGANQFTAPIYTARSGTVRTVEEKAGCDTNIVIGHSNNYDTRYCFKGTVKVKEGDEVLNNEQIGSMQGGPWKPTLNFGIFRDGNMLPIPGREEDSVTAGDAIPKDYPGIGTTVRPIPPRLKNEKLALATRLETITEGTIHEKSHVKSVMENLSGSVVNGSVTPSEAENTVRRLKLGEQVTERTLVGVGPAKPEVSGGQDYDLSTRTMKMTISTAISTMFGMLPFGKLIKKIPLVGETVVNTVMGWGRKLVKWLLKPLLKAPYFSRKTRTEINQAARELFGNVGKKGADTITTKLTGTVDALASSLRNVYLDMDVEQSLHDHLTEFNRIADPLAPGSFTGSLDGANRASEQGIAKANQLFKRANGMLDTFKQITSHIVTKIVKAVIDVATAAGLFTGGILSAIAQLANTLVTVGQALFSAFTAGFVFGIVTRLQANHDQTLDNIAVGHPQ